VVLRVQVCSISFWKYFDCFDTELTFCLKLGRTARSYHPRVKGEASIDLSPLCVAGSKSIEGNYPVTTTVLIHGLFSTDEKNSKSYLEIDDTDLISEIGDRPPSSPGGENLKNEREGTPPGNKKLRNAKKTRSARSRNKLEATITPEGNSFK
jgi:hypothetical protein